MQGDRGGELTLGLVWPERRDSVKLCSSWMHDGMVE